MNKLRAWPVRAMYTLVAVALVISLMITAAPPSTVLADAHDAVKAEWDMVATPSMEEWVLAPESEIVDFTTADPGQVAYAIVETDARPEPEDPNVDWAPWYLLKSTDHAATWKDITSGVKKEVRNVDNTDEDDPTPLYELVKVVCAPDDTDFVAVVLDILPLSVYVFISTDGGATFHVVPTGDLEIDEDAVFAFAVSPEVNNTRNLAIGGAEGSEGVIYRSKVIGGLPNMWVAAHIEDAWHDCDEVVAIAFSPNWYEDFTVLAVTVDEGEVHLQSGVWASIAWNEDAGFAPAVQIPTTALPGLGRFTAGIALPSDYLGDTASNRYVWVWVNSPTNGRIFRVINSTVNAISDAGQVPELPWLASVDYVGNIASGKAIAGLLNRSEGAPCPVVQVWRNHGVANMDICCPTWSMSCKAPTGNSNMVATYVKGDKAYAVAIGDTGAESAWSWSFDNGETWNQLSLIDTQIDSLSDVAVSPDCNKTMLVSVDFDGCDSVWYHAKDLSHHNIDGRTFDEYNGKWQRTWSGQLGDEQYGLLRLNPDEDNGKTVYLVDRGTSTLYYNDKQTLACWDRYSSKLDEIADLVVKTEKIVYAVDFDGTVSWSDNFGRFPSWEEPKASGVDEGWTIAFWGDEILVGGRDGDVAHSMHGTGNFTDLKNGLDGGLVTVAFDSYYGDNDTIYAAVDDFPQGGIYRWIIGESEEWFDMRATPSTRQLTGAGSKVDDNPVAYTGLVLDNPDGNPKTTPAQGGVLYASYVAYDQDTDTTYTGVARMLTPALDYCCDETEWDYLITAVTRYQDRFDRALFMMQPQALKICGCLNPGSYTKLFAIGFDGDRLVYDMEEGKFGTVWMFEDCYSKSGPDLRSPANGALVPTDPCECANLPFAMAWDRMCDSCNYEIEFALDSGFNEIIPVGQWDTPVPSSCIARMWHEVRPTPAMNPTVYAGSWFTPGETYYWRVRSVMAENGQTIRSWWSNERSFTVDLRATDGVYLIAPESGAHDQPRTNTAFTWGSNTKVDSYKFELSESADLSAPVESKTNLTHTAYTYTGTLKWDTPYYWRVTAIKDGAQVSMAIGTFRTMPEPPEPVEPEPVTTPNWVWVLIAIGAVLVIVVIVLIFRTRRV